jgi:cysteine desulfurase
VQRYYFDYNASAPTAPEVLEAMLPAMAEVYGNASSIHHFGQAARKKLDEARREVARFLGAAPEEIVFTSGATEADNLALAGVAQGGHIVTTAIEHPAVLMAARELGPVTVVPVDGRGVVDPDDIRRALRPDTRLVSVMHANNELGTVQPVREVARIAREAEIAMHCDGVQAAGRMPVSAKDLGAATYAISGHKLAGPKGIGALYVRKGIELRPMIRGGAHERSRRAGTENVAGAVGLARAARWAREHLSGEARRQQALRDRLEQTILDRIPDSHVNGAGAERIPNTTNIRFDGIDSDALLIALDLRGFAVSSGAACSSGATQPSHVLLAIGLTKEQARSSIRFSLGRGTTAEQSDLLVEALAESVAQLRKLSPAYA